MRGLTMIAAVCALPAAVGLLAPAAGQSERAQRPQRRSASAAAQVPPLPAMRGDYVNVGVCTAQRRTDIRKLLTVLKRIHATDYMHLVWTEDRYPFAWEDFRRLAPAFQRAGLRLWLYLTPPSEGVPQPFGGDYVRWALECAKIAGRYPAVAGLCIDDFNGNVCTFTPAYCRKMMAAAHKIAPHLALLVVCYYGYYARTIGPHVEADAIDGVIFPYFYPHQNHTDTTRLLPQIRAYRKWLDEHTTKAGLPGRMLLVVMVYATQHSAAPGPPTPAYVRDCLSIGLQAAREGLANGVVTYCLPKRNPAFVKVVAEAYARNSPASRPADSSGSGEDGDGELDDEG